ncbi:MAG: hypothetical protein CMI52_03155 [Parcubacteria group bacterium]|nr:hypothetical protein [Parcubacteria group bacterium]|tara:strand:- start:1521 stop:1994 length:474 start_codon:yes stop_codon:yes gene_type:complete
MFFFKNNYQKSQSATKVKFRPPQEARKLAAKLLHSKGLEEERQELSDDLLDVLADCAQLDIVKLKISETNQYHKKKGGRVVYKRYGYYKPDTKYIYIQNRTAVRGQILAPKTFIDTLLHEWMHHYDSQKLGLNSIHTKGFYMRIKDLKKKLGLLDNV